MGSHKQYGNGKAIPQAQLATSAALKESSSCQGTLEWDAHEAELRLCNVTVLHIFCKDEAFYIPYGFDLLKHELEYIHVYVRSTCISICWNHFVPFHSPCP